jgi:hypothetical protein
MYNLVLDRLEEPLPTDQQERWREKNRRVQYLTYRCGREFLEAYLVRHPDLLGRISRLNPMLDAQPESDLAARLHELGLLPEPVRKQLVDAIIHYFVNGEDPAVLSNERLRGLLTDQELIELRERILTELAPSLERVLDNWTSNFEHEYGPPEDYYQPLIDLLQAAGRELSHDRDFARACERVLRDVDDAIKYHDWHEADRREGHEQLGASPSTRKARRPSPASGGRSVFDDLLD